MIYSQGILYSLKEWKYWSECKERTSLILISKIWRTSPESERTEAFMCFLRPWFTWCKTCNYLAGKFSPLGHYFLNFTWKVSWSKVYIYQPNIRLEVQELLEQNFPAEYSKPWAQWRFFWPRNCCRYCTRWIFYQNKGQEVLQSKIWQ